MRLWLVGALSVSAAAFLTVALPRPGLSGGAAKPDGTMPNLYVGYYDSNRELGAVAAFSATGKQLDKGVGPFKTAPLVALDRSHNVFVADMAASTIYGYSPGSETPFETLPISHAQNVAGSTMAVDAQGNFWIGDQCGGSYCSIPGNLTEYDPQGNVKQVLSQCLLSFDALAVDRRGNAFAAGVASVDPPNFKDALVEFPAGTSSCRTIRGNRTMFGWAGGLQVTSRGDLVIDYSAGSATYLETLGGRSYGHVVARTTIDTGGNGIGKLALTHRDTEVWIMTGACGSDCWGVKYTYPAGRRVTTAGGFEHVEVGGVAATD